MTPYGLERMRPMTRRHLLPVDERLEYQVPGTHSERWESIFKCPFTPGAVYRFRLGPEPFEPKWMMGPKSMNSNTPSRALYLYLSLIRTREDYDRLIGSGWKVYHVTEADDDE